MAIPASQRLHPQPQQGRSLCQFGPCPCPGPAHGAGSDASPPSFAQGGRLGQSSPRQGFAGPAMHQQQLAETLNAGRRGVDSGDGRAAPTSSFVRSWWSRKGWRPGRATRPGHEVRAGGQPPQPHRRLQEADEGTRPRGRRFESEMCPPLGGPRRAISTQFIGPCLCKPYILAAQAGV